MLFAGSALKNYAIAATDGRIGTCSDFLFDDATWTVRWMVVDTGTWLTGRKVLIHPSAIGQPDPGQQTLPVRLTRAQVEASPDVLQDEPVSRRMEDDLYGYYGWDPLWGGGNLFGGYVGMMGMPLAAPPAYGEAAVIERERGGLPRDDGDPHLQSMTDITHCHVQAADGAIGHVENFLIDDAAWSIRYLVIDTRNWWFGQHVLLSPFAVQRVDWAGHEIRTGLTQERIKASPPWDPAAVIDRAYEQRLHGYYGWPGYGW